MSSMSSRINLFGLPALLLLPAMAVAFYFGHFLMGVMLTVSWVLHVRRGRDARYPSFGSWFHILISIGCSLVWVYVGLLTRGVGEMKEAKNVGEAFGNLAGTIYLMTPYAFFGVAAGFVFVGLQLFFWVSEVMKVQKKEVRKVSK